MLRSGRWPLAAAWLVTISALSAPSRGQTPDAPARTEAELAAARLLFAQALKDEQEARYDLALDEFRRVRDVRDTAPVEYRIATCLERLNRFTEALSAYEGAVRLARDDAAATASGAVAAESRERADALSKRVAHLQLTFSAHAPADAELRVDGKPRQSGDIVLDPGSHRVEASATGAPPFQSDVALPEGGRLALTVPLDPPLPAPSTLPVSTVEPHAPRATGTSSAWGWIAVGAGGALLAGAVTSLLLRESDIRTANRDCPGGGCIGSIYGEALSATNRARVEGPLGFGLGAAGLVTAGVGLYLVLRAPGDTSPVTLAASAWRDGAGLALRGAL